MRRWLEICCLAAQRAGGEIFGGCRAQTEHVGQCEWYLSSGVDPRTAEVAALRTDGWRMPPSVLHKASWGVDGV